MILMYSLSLLIDLSFYFTFAAPLCAQYGGKWNIIVLIPAMLYLIYVLYRRDRTLSLGRQRRIFLTYCKAAAIFLAALVVGRAIEAAAAALPLVIFTLAASVVLMRSLRHDQTVFTQRGYQVFNLLSIGGTVALAFVASSNVVLRGFGSLLNAIYQSLIVPVLLVFIKGLGAVLSALSSIFPGFDGWENGQNVEDIVSGAFEQQIDESLWAGATQSNGFILTIIAVVAAIAVLFFFFRWLGPKKGEHGVRMSNASFVSKELDVTTTPKQRESVFVRDVRSIYRKFLKLCMKRGMEVEDSHTSLDVEQQAKVYLNTDEPVEEIRNIYIRHRYGGATEADDLQKMKRYYKEIKKK